MVSKAANASGLGARGFLGFLGVAAAVPVALVAPAELDAVMIE